MKILGLPVPFTGREEKALAGVKDRGWHRVLESFSGAWQRNIEVSRETALTYHAVYSCMTLISSDIAKLRLKLVEQGENDVWKEVRTSPFLPVIKKPNPYQTRIQFYENWVLSRLAYGNTYVMKERDNRGLVTALRILDPIRVTPLVADNGDVYYRLNADNLASLPADIVVPAREIIHDRGACLYHPLVGVSPIVAAAAAAAQGIHIQNNSAHFFSRSSMPGGILSAPHHIPQDTADRLRETWNTKFQGENAGEIAVLGDGLAFTPLQMSAKDSELLDQLKWTADVVCSVFHVPPYKIGVGQMPTHNNIQALQVSYYTEALQRIIEDIELCLDEGLGLTTPKEGKTLGVEFDLDGLLRMDSLSQVETLKVGVGAGIIAPNEARARLNYAPVEGGNAPLMQEQNWSLEDLANRQAQGIAPPPASGAEEPSEPSDTDDTDKAIVRLWHKSEAAYGTRHRSLH